MKAKTILLVIAALIMSACAKTSEDKVTKAFKEYVKTDFGNPDDFIEITKIDRTDTMSTEDLSKTIFKIDTLSWILPKKDRDELERIKDKLSKDTFFIVQHKIKVRVKIDEEKREVVEYYVIEKDGEYTVQDHALRTKEMPAVFGDVLDFMDDVSTSLKIINGSY